MKADHERAQMDSVRQEAAGLLERLGVPGEAFTKGDLEVRSPITRRSDRMPACRTWTPRPPANKLRNHPARFGPGGECRRPEEGR